MPKNNNHAPSAPLWAGQNFLTSGRAVRRLLDAAAIGQQDLVVEIGSGRGHITRELLPRCGRLLAAELDPALCRRLTERFGGQPNFRLYQGDFLQMPLPKEPYKAFANIPFGRTTEILRRLTNAPNPPEAAWLIVEQGAAKRFAGRPGENLTSLTLRPFFQVRLAAFVPRTEFHPAPRVDAALLELVRRDQPDLPLTERRLYRAFLERAWKRGLGSMLTRRQAAVAPRLAGLPPAEDANLKYVQWLCLFRCWSALPGRK